MYYKLDENKNVVPATMYELEEILTNPDKKIVKQEYLGDKFISTVFLGIDHNFNFKGGKPIAFETMIYDETENEWTNYQDRYSAWQEAEEGHQRAVEWVKNGCKEDE